MVFPHSVYFPHCYLHKSTTTNKKCSITFLLIKNKEILLNFVSSMALITNESYEPFPSKTNKNKQPHLLLPACFLTWYSTIYCIICTPVLALRHLLLFLMLGIASKFSCRIPLFVLFCFVFRAHLQNNAGSSARGRTGAAAASLHHSSWQCQILKPLNNARDGTCIPVDSSRFRNPLSHNRSSFKSLLIIWGMMLK